jgi:hypothetical protein
VLPVLNHAGPAPARPWLAWPLVLAACFIDVGAGSTPATTATTDTTDATGEPTTSPPSTSTLAPTTGTLDPTTGTTTTSSSSSDPSSPATTDDACRPQGAPCDDGDCCGCLECIDGQCAANDANCMTCHACSANGTCVQADGGTPCTGAVDTCTTLAWGLQDGVCHAFAPSGAACDGDANCIAGECTDIGEAYIACPECVRSGDGCKQFLLLRDIAVGDVCHTSGTTETCGASCQNNVESEILAYQCTITGACEKVGNTVCSPFKCDEATDTCKIACTTDDECTTLAHCDLGGTCTY